jgi:hypothetical protein
MDCLLLFLAKPYRQMEENGRPPDMFEDEFQ